MRFEKVFIFVILYFSYRKSCCFRCKCWLGAQIQHLSFKLHCNVAFEQVFQRTICCLNLSYFFFELSVTSVNANFASQIHRFFNRLCFLFSDFQIWLVSKFVVIYLVLARFICRPIKAPEDRFFLFCLDRQFLGQYHP